LVEYDNSVNDSEYIYSGLTLTLNYNNFITRFGSSYRYTILNNDIYTFTGITGETHYFRIGGFNNTLNISNSLFSIYNIPFPTSTPLPTSTPTGPTPTPTVTSTITPTPTSTVYVDPPNISYSATTYSFTYAIFSQITIPAPVNSGGLITSYSVDVPTYPGLFFGINNSGVISFQVRMSPGQFDIYVTASNSGGEDIKRITIILT
jgi:hypothetical protein